MGNGAKKGVGVESQEETPVLETPVPEMPVPQPTTSSVASSAAGQVRARKATKRAGASPPKDTAQEPETESPGMDKKMETMLGQIVTGMQAMQQRLINLEMTQQQAKNLEETQSQESTPSQDGFKMVYPKPGSPYPMENLNPGPLQVREHV